MYYHRRLIGTLLPSIINKSLVFLTPDLTVRYFVLFEQAMDIEMHLRDSSSQKIRHMTQIQTMYQQLLECKGIKFDKS